MNNNKNDKNNCKKFNKDFDKHSNEFGVVDLLFYLF
jgi:hypothetical protein